ncbi:S8 family serine peptidase [Saccharopolyspora shandongensis]|uniref:S8 family serine peptidase n=1 Tax=Saccharopolyspora shandongensis TaxID=418495 RepID=UPI003400C8C5
MANRKNENENASNGKQTASQRRGRSNANSADSIRQRPERYLVAARPPHLLPPGARALDEPDALFDWLADQPDIRLVSRLSRGPGPGTGIESACPEIAVVEMPADRARALRGSVQLLVEPDMPLSYTDPNPVVSPLALPDPGVVVPFPEPVHVSFRVMDNKNVPLEGVGVSLLGANWPVHGRTGADGRVVLQLPADTLETVRSLFVRPKQDHWSIWVDRPELAGDAENVVVVRRMSETFEQFPHRQVTGWGYEAMGLDRIPPTHRAHGVRVAILDSGVDVNHPDLAERIVGGFDFVADNDSTWNVDEVGHGTACAGVITGTDNGAGIAGIAMDAEVHACKIFPNGRFSDLIRALDYCIEREIDIAHLSLGSPNASELVALKILDACNAGVACVAPAGNSGGMVTFPGTLPTVLTVAALGKIGEFPADSQHTRETQGWPTTAEGYFSPSFTCFGHEVNVCAPGVAIPTAAPPDGYAPQDGTAIAAAHITGLAALVLAHHDGFRDWFRARNTARIGHLFQAIGSSCSPIAFGDVHRTGAGLPNAALALGLTVPQMQSATSAR